MLFLEDLRSGGGGDEHSFVLERVLLGLYRGELERFLFLELTTLSLGALCWVLVSLFDPEEDLDTSSIEVLLCVSFDFFPPPDREVLDSAEPDEEPLLLRASSAAAAATLAFSSSAILSCRAISLADLRRGTVVTTG